MTALTPSTQSPSNPQSQGTASIYRTVLPNGIRLIVVENPVADIISARLFTKAGVSHEARSQAGLFSLLTSLLTKGTHSRSSMEIADQVESVGASLGSDTSADYSLISLKTVSADFAHILALAADLLRHPSFPQAEIDLEKRLTLQALRSMQEQPFTVAYNQLRQDLYGQQHPYALPNLGTAETVMQLDQSALIQAHQQYFRPDNLTVSIVGRITPAAAKSLVEQVLGDWQGPEVALPTPELPTLQPEAACSLVPQDTQQSMVVLGYLAGSVQHPDYAALKLISTYLGNGLSSRLFVELREKRGLAYDVSAFYPTRLSTSQFVVYIGTAPENTAVAVEGLQTELQRLCEVPLTTEELQTAKNKLLGQYALGKQTNAQIAQLLGWYDVLGLGVEFDQGFPNGISALQVEDIQAAACRCFDQGCISVVGPKQALDSVAAIVGH